MDNHWYLFAFDVKRVRLTGGGSSSEVWSQMFADALNEGVVDHGAVDDLRRQQRIDAPGILEQVREALAAAGDAAKPRSTAPAA